MSEELEGLLEHFYISPDPGRIVELIDYDISKGYLDDPAAIPPIVAFYSGIFKRFPSEVKDWMDHIQTLDNKYKGIFYKALWYCNASESNSILPDSFEDFEVEDSFIYLPSEDNSDILSLEINFPPSVVDMLWGLFSATGDERCVNRVLDAVISPSTPEENIAYLVIKNSLVAKAIDEHKVFQICAKKHGGEYKDNKAMADLMEEIIKWKKKVN